MTNSINEYIFTDKAQLNVFPNPTDGHVYINIDLASRKDGLVEIFDLLGKKVFEYAFKNLTAESIEADLSNQPKGMYTVTLRSGDEFISKKLVLQ